MFVFGISQGCRTDAELSGFVAHLLPPSQRLFCLGRLICRQDYSKVLDEFFRENYAGDMPMIGALYLVADPGICLHFL